MIDEVAEQHFNQHTLIGRITDLNHGYHDAANFTLSTVNHWRDKETGELKSQEDSHLVQARHSQARYLKAHCDNNDLVFVEGPVRSTLDKPGSIIIARTLIRLIPAGENNDITNKT